MSHSSTRSLSTSYPRCFKGTPALDAGLLAAAQAVEHYEIARYGTLRTWAAELGLQEQVIFNGWLADSDVVALYQHSTAHVMSSKLGPTNMPIWEAMAFGTPVITCDVGDMPWQVGDAGLIFPADYE